MFQLLRYSHFFLLLFFFSSSVVEPACAEREKTKKVVRVLKKRRPARRGVSRKKVRSRPAEKLAIKPIDVSSSEEGSGNEADSSKPLADDILPEKEAIASAVITPLSTQDPPEQDTEKTGNDLAETEISLETPAETLPEEGTALNEEEARADDDLSQDKLDQKDQPPQEILQEPSPLQPLDKRDSLTLPSEENESKTTEKSLEEESASEDVLPENKESSSSPTEDLDPDASNTFMQEPSKETASDEEPKEPEPSSEKLTETIVDPVLEKTPDEALAGQNGELPPPAESPDDSPQEGSSAESKEDKKEKLEKKTPLTLKDALEGAYAQSPLLTAEYQVKESYTKLSTAKRDWLPKVDATLGYSRNSGDYVSSGTLNNAGNRADSSGNTKSSEARGALVLRQNLYSGGATTAAIKAQTKMVDATAALYRATVRDTFLSATKAFIELSTKQEVFRLSRMNRALLQRQLEVVQNRYEFGELTRYDVAATQAKLDKANAEVIAALSETEIAKASFVKITGVAPQQPLEKAKEPSHLLPASKAEAIQIALQSNPDLQKQMALAEAAEKETDHAFGNLLPSFDVSLSASRRLGNTWDRNYAGGHGRTRREEAEAAATLSIPLDFRGSTQSTIRQHKYAAAQKRLNAIYERRNVMEQVSKYWDSLESARARIGQITSQVSAAKIAVETVTEEFLAGSKTTLDVLTAEQELFAAQVDLVNAEQSAIFSAYQLLATMGQLNEKVLDLDVKLYDPLSSEDNRVSLWGLDIGQDQRIQEQENAASLMETSEAVQ